MHKKGILLLISSLFSLSSCVVTPEPQVEHTEHVDNNNDGVCDVCGEKISSITEHTTHVDENNDGVCDICGEVIEVIDETKEASFIPNVGEIKLLFDHGKAGESNFYNYCPSMFIENNEAHVYYCTNKEEGKVTDYVGYRKGIIKNNKVKYDDEPSFVLTHGEMGSWDSRHDCDPSVIKGEFKYHDENYNYLMAFLGCVPSDCTQNETGIAVSKTPNGPWIKCDFKKDGVTKINPLVKCSEFSTNSTSWGTGQPSLVSVDKKGRVLLFTTIGATNGTFTNLREYDFSDIDNYSLIRERTSISAAGIKGTANGSNFINNGDYAYDEVNRRVLMVKERQFFGSDGKGPDFIGDTLDVYYIDDTEGKNVGDVLFAGNNTTKTWKVLGTIDKNLTGFLRNHNAGLITDPYARVDATKTLGVAFTRSDEEYGNNWTYLNTYRIYATAFDFPSKYFK